jgi:hypothetical protein
MPLITSSKQKEPCDGVKEVLSPHPNAAIPSMQQLLNQ